MRRTYSVSVMDLRHVDNATRRQAEEDFCAVLEERLGSKEAVATAYSDYTAALERHGELPLPAEATDQERAAVDRWESVERAATMAAFKGWHRLPEAAYFEVTLRA